MNPGQSSLDQNSQAFDGQQDKNSMPRPRPRPMQSNYRPGEQIPSNFHPARPIPRPNPGTLGYQGQQNVRPNLGAAYSPTNPPQQIGFNANRPPTVSSPIQGISRPHTPGFPRTTTPKLHDNQSQQRPQNPNMPQSFPSNSQNFMQSQPIRGNPASNFPPQVIPPRARDSNFSGNMNPGAHLSQMGSPPPSNSQSFGMNFNQNNGIPGQTASHYNDGLENQMNNMNLMDHTANKQRSRRVYASEQVSSPPINNPPSGMAGPQVFTPAAQPPLTNSMHNRNYPNPNPISNSGTPYETQKPRIDPNQMPSPVAVHALNQELFLNTEYITSTKTGVPLVNTQFTCIDEGNSNPNFVRMSMYNIPNTDELLKVSQLPLGLVVQPLASIGPNDTPLQIVDFGDEGPIRCLRCKTYINPYMVFIDGGKRFVCNLCKHENDVPDDYFCNLDMAGRRLDWDLRPELKCGSTEFVATKEFMSSQSGPSSYIFAIDVTWTSVQSGLIRSCANAIKEVLYTGVGLPLGVQFGLITYDRNVHFYNLSSNLEQAQMLLVSDIKDVFVPLSNGFLVDPYESRHVIEPLLDNLPQMFSNNRTAEPVLGPVLSSVHEALKGKGGKVFAFQSTMPTYGPGSLKHRDDPKIHNTEKEKSLYLPQDSFYRDMGLKFVDEGISANIYLFPTTYIDVASISQITDLTSGELYMYQSYHVDRDGPRFTSDLKYDATRNMGFNGVLRIRCSDGLRIAEYYGNMYMRNHVDVELPIITSDTSLAATLKHDGKLNENEDVYFQIALLYTSGDGRRLIRIHNLAIPCTTLIGNMFKYAEIDTSVNLLARMAVAETKSLSLRNIRENLQDQCVQILSAYRKNCAKGSAQGQLILPEAFKLLPIYILSLLKSPAFRSGANVQIDNRVFGMILLNTISVKQSMRYFYPKIAPIHEIYPPLEDNTQVMPPLVRASYSLLDPQGIYLLQSNSSVLYLWIGRQVDSSILNSLFGVPSVEQINPIMSQLPEIEGSKLNLYARRVSYALMNGMYTLPTESFIEDLSKDSNRVYEPMILVVRQSIDSNEAAFADLLVEDKNNDSMSYVDFLCHIHVLIQSSSRSKN
ncbi:Protein transport protein Sec24C [Smittium mucronatum]|uniref:Protein transport protein Sec24C n=1 Tax=Smittium mucronatum TaxID=133383 RepID=A0A1R0GLM5_9FUNG|nr:Protein transport protein Sec24C [Smittium mucronatum]